jgi:sugar phosphate isomerase/epimerase
MTLSKDNKVKTSHALTDELRGQMKKKLQDAGIKAGSYGVVGVPAKEEDARKVFAFAKEMGVSAINCEAKPDQLAMLDKLTEEFGVCIALHNHPKPSTYWDADTVLKAVEGRSKRIGSCADTGHWKRSDADPLECLKKLKGRIISLHFKDVIEAAKGWNDTPWGAGKCDAKGMLAELKEQGFKGVFGIEYEHGAGQALLDDVAKCIRFFDQTAAELK